MTKVTDKRAAILNTALEQLAINGFHNTPMSLIAKEAGVSAGIIYHYFESKEALIHELYREIKVKFSAALFVGEPQKLSGIESLRLVWFNAYHFYVSHPPETLFLEQYENSPYFRYTVEDPDSVVIPLVEKTQQAIKEGIIVDLPFSVLGNLTFGVAMSLAKQQIAKRVNLDEEMLEKIANAIVKGLQTA